MLIDESSDDVIFLGYQCCTQGVHNLRSAIFSKQTTVKISDSQSLKLKHPTTNDTQSVQQVNIKHSIPNLSSHSFQKYKLQSPSFNGHYSCIQYIAIIQIQMSVQGKVIIGLDFGGSLNKMVLVSALQLQLAGLEKPIETIFNESPLYIFTALITEPLSFLISLQAYLVTKTQHIEVGITGCGGIKLLEHIKALFKSSKVLYTNQYQANPQGYWVYNQLGMAVTFHAFIQTNCSDIQYTKQSNKSIHDIKENFMFVSFGSGVNFQKFGFSQKGIQRKKVDDPQTSYDGYSLGGTCLGASFLIGLISAVSNEKKIQAIIQSIGKDPLSKQIYHKSVVNIMQHALSLSMVHNLQYITISGNILQLKGYIDPQFKAALQLNYQQIPLRRTLVELDSLVGMLGALGAIYAFLS